MQIFTSLIKTFISATPFVFCLLKGIRANISIGNSVNDYGRTPPKLWHQYINEFLLIYSVNQDLVSQDILVELWRQTLLSKSLGEKSVREINMVARRVCRFYGRDFLPLDSYVKKQYHVKSVSGRILTSLIENLVCNPSCTQDHISLIWIFTIDVRLCLNLSIASVYFTSGVTKDCSKSSLAIYSKLRPHTTTKFCSEEAITSGHVFKYCGEQSAFNLYPQYSNVYIKVLCFKFASFKINILFTLLDRGILMSLNNNSKLFNAEKLSSTLVIGKKEAIYFYKLQTKKIYFLIIYALSLEFIMFDGPGLHSNMIKNKKNSYKSSSFQCLVKVVTSMSMIYSKETDMIPYVSNLLPVLETLNIPTSGSSLEINDTNKSPIIIKMSVPYGYYVNITVTEIQYQGLPSQTCQYGGLVTAELLDNDYKESSTLCQSHIGVRSSSRSFYSSNSSLYLALYQYKYYSEIKAKMIAHPTKCQQLQICDCTFTALCSRFMWKPQKDDLLGCEQYLKRVTKYSDILFTHQGSFVGTLGAILVYPIVMTHCFVLQVIRNESHNENDTCTFAIAANPLTSPGFKIDYNIIGSLISMERHIYEVEKCNIKKCKGDNLYFYRDIIRFLGLIDSYYQIKPKLDYKQQLDYSHSVRSSLIHDVDVNIFTSFKTPMPEDRFIFETSFFLYSKSWVDVTVHINPLKCNSGLLLECRYLSETLNFGYYEDPKIFPATRKEILYLSINITEDKFSLTPTLQSESADTLYTWEETITFTAEKADYYVSIPGKIASFRLWYNYVDFTGQAIWLADNYHKFSHHSFIHASSCSPLMQYNLTKCSNFSFYSSDSKTISYVLFTDNGANHEHFLDSRKASKSLVSWKEAASICRHGSGFLPYFTNREELEELLALLKLSPYMPALLSIFIGLKIDNFDQKTLRWENKSPVAFQKFENVKYGDYSISVYDCCIYPESKQKSNIMLSCHHIVDMKNIQNRSSYTPYPHIVTNDKCTLMLVSNLAKPEWVYIDCDKKLLPYVLCLSKSSVSKVDSFSINHKNVINHKSCSMSHISKNGSCYLFLWYSGYNRVNTSLQQLCYENKAKSKMNTKMEDWMFLLESVSTIIPPILIPNLLDKKSALKLHYQKYLDAYFFETDSISLHEAEGLNLCESAKNVTHSGINLFQCQHGTFVSHLFVCDGNFDCPNDTSDEQFCVCNNTDNYNCKEVIQKPGKMCGPLHFQSIMGECITYYTTNPALVKDKSKHLMLCANNVLISEYLQDDLFADCGPGADDEQELLALLVDRNFTLCTKPYELPCKQGHSKCFNITDICIYELGEHNQLVPCRNGGHLENCKAFECNEQFKCQLSYCIPWAYVCDGKWDCPKGDDESYPYICKGEIICQHMFKCRKSHVTCIPIGNVCDGKQDCMLNDDEHGCELKDIHCPRGCHCLLFAITCHFSFHHHGSIKYPFIAVFVADITVKELGIFSERVPQALHIKLLRIKISEMCNVTLPLKLLSFEVSFSNVKELKKDCFQSLAYLRSLIMIHDGIIVVKSHSFSNLTKLVLLNLSSNLINKLNFRTIFLSPELKFLSIRNNSFKDITNNMFGNMQLKFIDTTDYHICCVAKNFTCSAKRPWHVSCQDMLPKREMRVLFICIASLTLIMNTTSIVIHSKAKSIKRVFTAAVIALNINDILCGLYLTAVSLSDIIFRDTFLVKEKLWRSSTICFLLSGLVLWFTLLTQGLLIFLSLSRLMVVAYPLNSSFKRTIFVLKSLFGLFCSSLCFSCLLALALKLNIEALPLSLCLPFIDPTNSILTIKLITWCVVLSQLATSLAILSIHAVLVKELKRSQKTIESTKSISDSNVALLVQLAFVTCSNILCWFPANAVYVSAMFLATYPTDLVIWTTVGILPINSIINPTVFVGVCLRKYLQEKFQLCK